MTSEAIRINQFINEHARKKKLKSRKVVMLTKFTAFKYLLALYLKGANQHIIQHPYK